MLSDRRAIQRQIFLQGYYFGRIDGEFGAGTYDAIQSYASETGASRHLGTRAGVRGRVYSAFMTGWFSELDGNLIR